MYGAIGMVGAVIGATLVTKINENLFKPVIGGLILFLVIWMLVRKSAGVAEHETETSPFKKKLFYFTAPILGFYESIFGSGNGIIFSSLAIKLRGTDLTKSLGYYYFISFFWNLTTVVVLVRAGYFNIPLMIAATVGALFGAHIGSRIGRTKGNRFVKYAFITVGSILGLKLVFGL